MWACLLFVVVLFQSSCRREDSITRYSVPKESPATGSSFQPLLSNPSDGMTLPPNHPPITPGTAMSLPAQSAPSSGIQWKTPSGWQEQSPSSMRVGSFLIRSEQGQAEVSIIPLAGEAGGHLANVNRWRGQIGLDPLSEEALAQQSQWIEPAGRKMFFVEYVHQGKRIMAAIFSMPDRTWFFKMTGDDRVVSRSKPQFLDFLAQLSFSKNS